MITMDRRHTPNTRRQIAGHGRIGLKPPGTLDTRVQEPRSATHEPWEPPNGQPSDPRTARRVDWGQIGTFITGVATAAALIFTAVNVVIARDQANTAEQGQITDRFTKAVEQLGAEKPEVRIGGAYALNRIASDSPRDHSAAMDVLAAFVRTHPPAPLTDALLMWPPVDTTAAADLYTAADIIKSQSHSAEAKPINLSGARLAKMDFAGVDLSGADLSGIDLTGANLTGANLSRAKLLGATLAGADLTNANLADTSLINANLRSARLTGASVTRTEINATNLTGISAVGIDLASANFVSAQLAGAVLKDADLSNISFVGMDLSGALLDGANLGGTDLRATTLVGTDLRDVDLTHTRTGDL
ncbi:pentapeptide repeat-containing protein [Saccharopolyspora endophytica]|uniref:Pentapeptide repeat-containing protein n=1 Tax=Saccharopolyspora endophytica TaxID=543886 RepID=A0ABS5D8U8_9PSEU|nr:pentapeptide repeat-containing protein [Saccharopolyspora endophytica]MBQ0922697.1 pentapeptide repeat-containing protein [Saccharopolyspora endophytica]